MSIEIADMEITFIPKENSYEIEYENNVFVINDKMFHTIYFKHNNSQTYRILKEMFKNDKFLKECKHDKSKDMFWLNLINTDLAIPKPKPASTPLRYGRGRPIRGGFGPE
jgi:hypothetical protein